MKQADVHWQTYYSNSPYKKQQTTSRLLAKISRNHLKFMASERLLSIQNRRHKLLELISARFHSVTPEKSPIGYLKLADAMKIEV